MSRLYASGRYSRFICDRCGLAGAYAQSVIEQETHLRVHQQCLDEPIRPWRAKGEPQALRDPRPDDYEPNLAELPWDASSDFYTADNAHITADGQNP